MALVSELLIVSQQRIANATEEEVIWEEMEEILDLLLATPAAELVQQLLWQALQESGTFQETVRGAASSSPELSRDDPAQDIALLGTLLQPHACQQYAVLPVFYATDRASTAHGHYGTQRGDLQFGVAEVSIPDRHKVGFVEHPKWWRLDRPNQPERFVTILNCEPMTRGIFTHSLNQLLGRVSERSPLVFVHGYNVSFTEGIQRVAQIAYDLHFPGIPVLYSWPSLGSPLRYTVDETNVSWTQSHFQNFLKLLMCELEACSLDLIAHSMGAERSSTV